MKQIKKIEEVEKKIIRQLSEVELFLDFELLKKIYFGKKGVIKKMIEEIKSLSIEEKRQFAPAIQRLKIDIENLFNQKEKYLKKTILDQKTKAEKEKLDYKLPKIGHLHPLTQTIRMLNLAFIKMGYSIVEGPEIETDEFCFQNLNLPANHPARDMQDAIYLKEPDILLRTQSSSIEARVLKKYKPPFKAVCSGKIYRNEKVNKSNHFFFHQYQGFVVVKKTSLKDLFGTLRCVFETLYGLDVKIRFRNKYYPEVSSAVGADMECFNCTGNGCTLCKGVGWVEMGGAGIIHSNVLKIADINPEKWMGFAFGLGLDRATMAKYKITDIRTLSSGNLAYKYYENESII